MSSPKLCSNPYIPRVQRRALTHFSPSLSFSPSLPLFLFFSGCACAHVCVCVRACVCACARVCIRPCWTWNTRWTGVEHALAAINNACCSNKLNINVLHANGGMVCLSIVSAPYISCLIPNASLSFLSDEHARRCNQESSHGSCTKKQALLIRLLDRVAGPKVREFAALVFSMCLCFVGVLLRHPSKILDSINRANSPMLVHLIINGWAFVRRSFTRALFNHYQCKCAGYCQRVQRKTVQFIHRLEI